MNTHKNKKFNLSKLLNTVLNYTVKVLVLSLFIFMFIGRLSPSRISGRMTPNKSIAKTAFFFKSYVSEIIEMNKEQDNSGELENPFGNLSESTDDEESYDDFYANFAAMVAASAEEDSDEDLDYDFSDSSWDDDSELGFSKAEKIQLVKFSDEWNEFKLSHEGLAAAFEKAHTGSLFTFFAVLLTLLGIYFIYGTKKIRSIGCIIFCLGSILTAFSMTFYSGAYNMLNETMDMFDIQPLYPSTIPVFIVFPAFAFLCSLGLFISDKIIAAKKADSEKVTLDLEPIKSEFNPFPFQVTFRILSLLLFILLFIPGANPARISLNINRNVSLFTSGFSYPTYIANLQRALIRGWLPESVTRIAWISSLIACLGITACGVGSCMSVGNNKLKRYAHITLFAGSGLAFASLFGILYAYNLISSSPNTDRVLPLEPGSISIFFILLAIIFVSTLVTFIKTPAPEKDEKCHIEPSLQLFLMILPCLILVFLFSYLPLWGWRYAFFDYNPGDTLSMDSWVGLKWFKAPFENAATRSDILRVLRNTLIMSGLGILGSWLPMAFAIFLSEIKNLPARKIIQTLTTIPNFISWVLVYAIAFCIFGTEGFISSLMVNSGIWDKGKNMLMGSQGIWIKMWLWGVWKSLGWSAIMYIAAISGIDQQLYEAATVDGAGRFQKIWHITVPELMPTYIVLLILSISGILSNGMDQYLVFKNPTNKDPIEVLDLYVYQLTFGSTSNSNIPFSTVVSMFKSLVSVILLFLTNKISKIVRGNSIF